MSHDVEALVFDAQRMRMQGRFAEAKGAAEKALLAEPGNAAAWFHLGAALGGLRDLPAAEAAYRRALACKPAYAEAWSNLGGVLVATDRLEQALSAYRSAVEANPGLAPVWSNFGSALCDARRYAEGESACRRAVQLDERFVPGWLNLGRALHASKRPDEARAACERAVQLAPTLAQAWAGLANARMGLRDFTGAIETYRKAIALQPQNADLHANLGVAFRRIGMLAEGDASLRKALELDPSHDFALWNLGMALLERGELAEGWAGYESRWNRPDPPQRRFASKGGAPFAGKVLVWGEQGIGDQVLYAPMAAELASSGAAVTLECDPRLVALFRRSFPGIAVVSQANPPQVDAADFDHVVPLASLGGLLRNAFAAFPRHSGYLAIDPVRHAHYRRILAQLEPRNSLVVAIAWRSTNPELANEKSAALKHWGPVLRTPGVTFVSLQYGDVDEERRAAERRFGVRIETVPQLDVFSDLDGLAAAQAACDLVLTTSTVNAHLGGATATAVWVLLPKRIGTLWYWFTEREDSPWYPSLSLIRQREDGDWSGAIGLAAGRLRERLAARIIPG